METAELKPLLSALVLPPAGPLLLALFGLLVLRRRPGKVLAAASLVLLWLLSCNAVAILLSQGLLPQVAPLSAASLAARPVQAIVVLGGGVEPEAPEYGEAQLAGASAARLRYGVWLARQAQRPLAFAGGVGWGNAGTAAPSEGEVARRTALQDSGVTLRWVDEQSRDTAENAAHMKALLQREGIERIALVTHAWHMPRALQAFERAGFQVTPAPMGYITPQGRPLLEWLPSAQGLWSSRQVLHEWLGLQVARL
ncbi:YdcF family protein [Variovorax terrae]|uniref:YdcF family protein n=1 Tax=Variovorax terrae TaxID=2923278 RepID=A0A9X1VSL0_9BURK|nr:YdcF family protein [Variovorax terrae]MCJ0762294.1 YdcF family protein [Variovorax terrae]